MSPRLKNSQSAILLGCASNCAKSRQCQCRTSRGHVSSSDKANYIISQEGLYAFVEKGRCGCELDMGSDYVGYNHGSVVQGTKYSCREESCLAKSTCCYVLFHT